MGVPSLPEFRRFFVKIPEQLRNLKCFWVRRNGSVYRRSKRVSLVGKNKDEPLPGTYLEDGPPLSK